MGSPLVRFETAQPVADDSLALAGLLLDQAHFSFERRATCGDRLRDERARAAGAGVAVEIQREQCLSLGDCLAFGDVTLGDGPGGCFVLDLPAIERVD